MSLIHCGGKKSKEDTIVSVPPPIEFSLRPPADYFIEDNDCISSKENTTLELTKTTVFSFGLKSNEVALSNVKSGSSLESSIVAETQFGIEFSRTCDSFSCLTESGLPESWQNSFEHGGLLKICKDGFLYNRQSYEGVGLTTLYYLDRAFERFQEMIDDRDFEIEKVRLLILPIFKTVYNKYVDSETSSEGKLIEYITHNAGYFPKTEGANPSPILAIFPETSCLLDKVSGYLWESSFVSAHEFSHHIEKSYFPMFLTKEIFAPQWQQHLEDDESFETDPILSKISYAISESFGDLLGYYSDYASGESILAIDGFGYNRMVGFGSFKNNAPKYLNKDVVDIFLNQNSSSSTTNNSLTHMNEIKAECNLPSEDPNFSDSHTIGAIIAHALDSSFKIISAWEENQKDNEPSFSKSDIKNRYILTVAWLKKVRESRKKFYNVDQQDGKQYFQILSDALEQVLDEYFTDHAADQNKTRTIEEVKKSICSEISSSWPVIDNPPFIKQYPNCK